MGWRWVRIWRQAREGDLLAVGREVGGGVSRERSTLHPCAVLSQVAVLALRAGVDVRLHGESRVLGNRSQARHP